MYSIDTSYIKKSKKPFILFVIFGVLFVVLCVTLFTINHVHGKAYDGKVKSTTVSVEKINDTSTGTETFKSTYIFKAEDGKEYTCDPNDISDTYPGTNNKEVYYEKKNPTNCVVSKHMKYNSLLLFFSILPLLLTIIGLKSLKRINYELKALEILNKKGKLVKNLPYLLDYTGTFSKGAPVKRPVIKYVLENGAVLPLYGYKRKDRTYQDEGGVIDLVIDEENSDNFFIDFNINRLTGNLPTDFYTAPAGKQPDKKTSIDIPTASNNTDAPATPEGPKEDIPSAPETSVPKVETPATSPKVETPKQPEIKVEEPKNDVPALPVESKVEAPKNDETSPTSEVKIEENKNEVPSVPEAPIKIKEEVKAKEPKNDVPALPAEPKVEVSKNDVPALKIEEENNDAPKAPEAPAIVIAPEVKIEENNDAPKAPEAPVSIPTVPSAPEAPDSTPTAPSAPEVPKIEEIQEIK